MTVFVYFSQPSSEPLPTPFPQPSSQPPTLSCLSGTLHNGAAVSSGSLQLVMIFIIVLCCDYLATLLSIFILALY